MNKIGIQKYLFIHSESSHDKTHECTTLGIRTRTVYQCAMDIPINDISIRKKTIAHVLMIETKKSSIFKIHIFLIFNWIFNIISTQYFYKKFYMKFINKRINKYIGSQGGPSQSQCKKRHFQFRKSSPINMGFFVSHFSLNPNLSELGHSELPIQRKCVLLIQ